MEILILGHMKRLNSMEDKFRFSAKDIALIGAMIAVIEVCKAVLSFMPNVELTTFWLIMFTLYFGRKVIAVVPAFILVEGIIYGMNTWWIMYLYIWPLLVLLTWLFRKEDSGDKGRLSKGHGFCGFPAAGDSDHRVAAQCDVQRLFSCIPRRGRDGGFSPFPCPECAH